MLDGTESARTRPIDGAAIGWRVHELIGRPGAMQRFREVLLAWVDDRDQQHRVHDEWEQRREEHFRSSVARKKKRLLDEVAGPPGDGWRFEGRSLYREPRKGRRKWRGVFGVWCPPDLAADAEPPVDDPLSFCDCSDWPDPGGEPNRPLSLEEKYVVCAAFHDAFCLGVEKINPWGDSPDSDDDRSWPGGAYYVVCEDVKNLHEADRPAVESFLADVTRDLSLPGGARPKTEPDRTLVSVATLRAVVPQRLVRGDSSKLTRWLRSRNVFIEKVANKMMADAEDAKRAFSQHKSICKHIDGLTQDGEVDE